MLMILISAMLSLISGNLYAQMKEKPLLQEKKSKLYRRVITHPATLSYPKPNSDPTDKIIPFTIMYVYEEVYLNGQKWYRCATNSDGINTVWIKEEKTTDFKHSLVATFAELVGREPVIFFDRQNTVLNILKSPDAYDQLTKLYSDIKHYSKSNIPVPDELQNFRMEPDHRDGSISPQNFYIMPIINYYNSLDDVILLEVATIDADLPDHVISEPIATKIGYVFVIDTTISMQPYIDSCKDLTKKLFDIIPTYDNSNDIYFAFIAFRNNVTKPGIEYTTKVIAPFTSFSDKNSFSNALAQVQEAKASTHSFNEDSYAGIKAAYDDLNWDGFKGGIIFLLTDAPPLDSKYPLRSTDETPATLRQRAKDKNIKNIVLHLKTAEDLLSHDIAQSLYESLSFEASGIKSYIDIPLKDITQGQDPEIFENIIQTIFSHAQEALNDVNNNIPTGNENNFNANTDDPTAMPGIKGDIIRYSFRTYDLGQKNKTNVPKVVRSWIADKDLALLLSKNRREVPSLEIAVFLTRNQLMSLTESTDFIVKGFEEVRFSQKPLELFDHILSVAANFATDPTQYTLNPQASTIGELGIKQEFLDDLPYKSEIMTITEKQWDTFDNIRRTEFINELSSKLKLYQEYYADQNKWFRFDTNSEEYIKLPLSLLP
ncbi:MAG: VWA domain-containing protein [Clostridiales Family XIII bacterium]|jgi:serine/threonine-protein kinase PpkA|nr:VWA domain-containing protein [Clostridiales Family XIII bacterium]